MPLREVLRVEREAMVHVCMQPQTKQVKGGVKGGLNRFMNGLRERLPGGYGNGDNIAVIIANQDYGSSFPALDNARTNGEAVRKLLVEILGYEKKNVIVLDNAKRADMLRIFGGDEGGEGELAARLRANPDARLLVYYVGHASSQALGTRNYLLPVDAVAGDEASTAFPLELLYERLRRIDARSSQLFLEASFSANRSRTIVAPNISEREVDIEPVTPVRGLAVMAAARGDQRALVDIETGLGLFTRYLLAGMAGRADERPLGNGDRIIDAVELYAFIASRVRLAARKTLGLMQEPVLERSENLFLSQLSRRNARKGRN
jgi:hypothetical protein